jgi:hypothetical protein
MFYLPYRLSDSCLQFYLKNNNPKKPLYFSILSLLFHISFIHPISLPSSFGISPLSFLSLSHFATSIPHVFNCLSLLIAHSAPSFLSFCFLSSFPRLTYTVSPQVLRNFLCHTPFTLPVVSGFFDSLLSFLLICVFVPFTQLYIHPFFLLLSFFPLLHWHTRSFGRTFLSPSLCSFSFLSSILLLFCTLRFLSSNFAALFPSFTLSPFLLYFSLNTQPAVSLSIPSTHLKYFSCTLSTSFCSFHPRIFAPYINILYHALEHHHPPPEITSPLSLSYSPHTSHYLVCLPHYLSDVCLIRDSFIECIAQVCICLSLFVFSIFTSSFSSSRTFPSSFFHFYHVSFILCHNYQAICKRQTPKFLSTHHTTTCLF